MRGGSAATTRAETAVFTVKEPTVSRTGLGARGQEAGAWTRKLL